MSRFFCIEQVSEVVLYHCIDAVGTARGVVVVVSATVYIFYAQLAIIKEGVEAIGYNVLSVVVCCR